MERSNQAEERRPSGRRRVSVPSLTLVLGLTASSLFAAEEPLRVRASVAVAPCMEAAGRAYEAATSVHLATETGALRGQGPVDVLVGSLPEMVRALEGGDGVIESELTLARIPWVLSVAPGNPLKLSGLADLERPGLEVDVLGGPAAYEARRALASRRLERLRETTDRGALRAASVALVPLSLAGPGDRIAVELPPIVASAALSVRATQPEAARAFLRFLASEPGQRVFAACAPPR